MIMDQVDKGAGASSVAEPEPGAGAGSRSRGSRPKKWRLRNKGFIIYILREYRVTIRTTVARSGRATKMGAHNMVISELYIVCHF